MLPLICRIGHVTRNDIGAIRIAQNESYFEVAERSVPGFVKAMKKNAPAMAQDGILVEASGSPEEWMAAGNGPPKPRTGPRTGPRPAPRGGKPPRG
jgi:ATP-dependent RNA helicase DeaD